MHSMRNIMIVTAVGAVALPALAQTAHEGDLFVGINGTGQLTIEFDFDSVTQLPEIDENGVHGWLDAEPGFASLDEDEPDEDFYMLADGADIYVQLVSADPAFKVYDPFFTLMAPGESFALGGHEFDDHPFWHIDSDDASFDPSQSVWTATFRVTDLGSTGYADSQDYTIQFTNVPAPATLAVGALGLGAMRRRRA